MDTARPLTQHLADPAPSVRPSLSIVAVAPATGAESDAATQAEWVAHTLDDVTYELIQVDGGMDAVAEGIRRARGTRVAVLGDATGDAAGLLPALLAASSDADLVVASRHIPGGSDTAPRSQRLAERARRALAATVCRGARICTDPLSTVFLVRHDVIEGMDLSAPGDAVLLTILARGRWTRLMELPWRACSPCAAHLSARDLRGLGQPGPRRRGAIRYRYQRILAEPEDPQPLDDDLPEAPEVAGQHRRRLLWMVGLMALALRVVLLPLGHYWDLTVDYNVFIDLARTHSPYDTMRYLSHIAQSAGWDTNYEYYAYPPVPIYIYYPLARLFGLLHPTATYFIAVPNSNAVPSLPVDFYFFLKFPVWIADFLIAAVLARMSGTIRGWRDYLLNPYVLLVSGAWTFDAVMVLGLVLGAYWLQQGKLARSGMALAFGTMVKFIPAIAVPTFVLYLIKKKRPLREIVLLVGAYAAACAILLGPFLPGLLYVVSFHGSRVGGGMNWEMYWELWRLFPIGTNPQPTALAVSAFGMPLLAITLLLAYWYGFVSDMRLNRMIIVTLLAFFIGSKLVNEQYALVMLPFAFLEARQVGGAWRWFARLFWIVPLAFAVMRVPIDRFLWPLYHSLFGARADVIAVTSITGFESPFIPWQNGMLDQVCILVLGISFWALSVTALLWPLRPRQRQVRHMLTIAPVPVPVSVPVPLALETTVVTMSAAEPRREAGISSSRLALGGNGIAHTPPAGGSNLPSAPEVTLPH